MSSQDSDSNPATASRVSMVIAMVAIVIGTVLRSVEFARGRPLWLDEAMLALNIGARSFGELTWPLDYDQTAPLLYLWAERAAVMVAGVGERSLRALPFIAGVALLPLVWVVGRRLAGATTASIATVLAALSVTLLSFSAEGKQYGVDAAVTLVVVWLALGVRAAPDRRASWVRLAGGGALCVLASQPVVFTLGAVLAALVADPRVRRAPLAWQRLVSLAVVWGVLFALLYVTTYSATAGSSYMQRFWAGTYLDPRAPDFVLRLRMFGSAAFAAPTLAIAAFQPVALLAVAWLAGLWTLWRRDAATAALVGGPLLVGMTASVAGLYPVMDRLYLFAAPLVLVAYASLAAAVIDRLPSRSRPLVVAATCALLAATASPAHITRIARPVYFAVGSQVIADVDGMSRGEPVYVAARSYPLWVFYTTDWAAPDLDRVRWAASISGAGQVAHNNAPPRRARRVGPREGTGLARAYRGRVELVGLPTGRQYLTSTRALDPRLTAADLALPLTPDSGWAAREVSRMAEAAQPRMWVFGSHMFALDGAEPSLVAELQRRGVRLVMARRQGSTVAYQVEFPDAP